MLDKPAIVLKIKTVFRINTSPPFARALSPTICKPIFGGTDVFLRSYAAEPRRCRYSIGSYRLLTLFLSSLERSCTRACWLWWMHWIFVVQVIPKPNLRDIWEKSFQGHGDTWTGLWCSNGRTAVAGKYRRRLGVTNAVECLNEKIRRRERIIRIFLDRETVIRLIGALLIEIDDQWSTGKRYLDMDESFR